MANKRNLVAQEAPTQSEKQKPSTRSKRRQQRPNFLNRIFGFMRKKKGDTVELDVTSDDVAIEEKGQATMIAFIIERVMEEFLQKLALAGLKTLKSEWADVSTYTSQNPTATLYEFNMRKNFPGGLLRLDATRISLTFNVLPETDYIHANWFQTKLCNLGLRLILTQAPQDATVNDFFRCIYQEKVRSVVMLCEKYENNRRVCNQYWPLVVGTARVCGALRVYYSGNVTPGRETAYVKQHLVVSHKSEKAHDCYVYVCKTGRGGSPDSIRATLRTLRAVVDDGHTVMVHGGAGTGRTGTFAATMVARKMLLEGKNVSIPVIVREICDQRMGAVDTEICLLILYEFRDSQFSAFIHHYLPSIVERCKQLINHLDAYRKEYIAAGNRPIEVKSGPFEIKVSATKSSMEQRNPTLLAQPIKQQTPLMPRAPTQPTTNKAGYPMPPQTPQADTKGDNQYVFLNNMMQGTPPPGNTC